MRYEIDVYHNCIDWIKNDNWHREYGAAREWADGYKQWWCNGYPYDLS